MNADDLPRSSRRSGSGRWRSGRSRRARRKGLLIFFATLVVVAAVVGAGLYHLLASEPAPLAASGAAAAAGPGQPVERTAALAPLNLPADDRAHGSGMEWWYYSGILNATSGERYAFHVAVFVANGLIKHTVLHAALTDLQSGRRFTSQSRTGGMPSNAVEKGFDFRPEGWQVSGSGPAHVVRAALDGAWLTLDLKDSHPVVAHRAADSRTPGLLDFGQSGISYYYSRPRMEAQGEVSIAGKQVPVRGEVWFDHQWGEFDVLTLGWNWFALHLADGSDVMLYALFDMEGRNVLTAGTVSDGNGAAVPLKAGETVLTPAGTWTSPRTRISYVVEWDLKLPSGVYHLKPHLADAEFDAAQTTANVYWEGPVKVTGGAGGEGFMELSGYDRVDPAKLARK
ncbi:lipocalin family protein [Variovorax sp. J31P179]|uniref:lipocalin family protein n=1 Tax=Variovorax sp. J31P179 TaxID=3053508 RepID=UPI0033653DF5